MAISSRYDPVALSIDKRSRNIMSSVIGAYLLAAPKLCTSAPTLAIHSEPLVLLLLQLFPKNLTLTIFFRSQPTFDKDCLI
jgi:hypothetical protein